MNSGQSSVATGDISLNWWVFVEKKKKKSPLSCIVNIFAYSAVTPQPLAGWGVEMQLQSRVSQYSGSLVQNL